MAGFAKVDFRLPAVVRQEGKWFYSSCPILDVNSQGKSRPEALSNLIEALQLFLESCFERGTLSQVLRESGFEPGERDVDEAGEEYVNVPFSLIARRHAETRAS